MKKRIHAIIIAAVTMLFSTQSLMPSTVFADNQNTLSAEQILSQLDAEERAQFETLADYLKITDLDEFFDEVRSRSYSPDDYIDLDGDGDLTLSDALFVAQFLNGMVDYAYDYNDMDATNDHVIDEADAMAYMSCYSYHILFNNPFTPGSHGAARTIDTTFENRTYYRYDCQDEELDPVTYTLTLPTSSVPSNYPSNNLAYLNNQPNSRIYQQSYDDRVVIVDDPYSGNYGTGFIVGEHIIATNAHCVYVSETNYFKTTTVTAYKYANNNSHTQTSSSLTVLFTMIPYAYVNAAPGTTGETQRGMYDYALVYVEENLISTLGYDPFPLGLFLDGVPNLENNNTGLGVKLTGFPEINSSNPNGFFPYPSSSSGFLYSYNNYRFNTTTDFISGSSGSPVFIDNSYETVFGIHNSGLTDALVPAGNTTIHGQYGVIISRPLLQFFLNNPLDNDN